MRKIPTLFVRDWKTHRVTEEVTPGCEWVLACEGNATVKYDGVACLWQDDHLWTRYDAKAKIVTESDGTKTLVKLQRPPPVGFLPAGDPDPISGHWPGWIPVGDGPEHKYHREALANINILDSLVEGRTYELFGPKVQGNPHGASWHFLIMHGLVAANDVEATFDGIRERLGRHANVEGIVFWRKTGDLTGDLAKIKARDFGLPWPSKQYPPTGGG